MHFCHTNHIISSTWLLAAMSDCTERDISHAVGQHLGGRPRPVQGLGSDRPHLELCSESCCGLCCRRSGLGGQQPG